MPKTRVEQDADRTEHSYLSGVGRATREAQLSMFTEQSGPPPYEAIVRAPEGQRAVAVRRLPGRNWKNGRAWGPVYGVGVYYTHRRVLDGRLVWALEDALDEGTFTYWPNAEARARAVAIERALPLVRVKRGTFAEE